MTIEPKGICENTETGFVDLWSDIYKTKTSYFVFGDKLSNVVVHETLGERERVRCRERPVGNVAW